MLKRYIIFLVLFLMQTSVSAQYNAGKVKALRIQIKNAPDSLQGNLYNKLISQFSSQSMFDSVESVAAEMKAKAIIIHNRKMESNALMWIGGAQDNQGNYDKSVASYLDALKIKEEIKDVRGQSIALLNLGIIYYERNNYEKATELLNKSLALKIQINDKRGQGIIYENLGDIANSQHKTKDAITWFTKSRELAIEAHDTIDIATANQQLADQYLNLNNFKEAEKLAVEAYPILKVNNDRNLASCLMVLSKVYTAEGDYAKAISYAMEGYHNAVESGFPLFIGESCLALANTYAKMNRYDSSYFYQKKFTQINDSILSAENSEKIAEMQVKYETEKNEKEIDQLGKQNSDAALALSEKRNQISLIIGISLFIIITIVAFYFYNNTKKQKEIIETIIATEEKERKKIASDLHDGVGQTLSAARIGLSNLESDGHEQEKIKNVSDLIDASLGELKTMAGNLMPLALKGKGLTESIGNICRQYNKPNVQEVSFKTYNLPDKLQSVVEINTYRICQELLNNSVKYSKAKEIFLQLFCRDNKLIIQFEDNGIGFNKNKIKEGTLGMNILKERVALLNGEIEIESTQQKGTTIFIEFLL